MRWSFLVFFSICLTLPLKKLWVCAPVTKTLKVVFKKRTSKGLTYFLFFLFFVFCRGFTPFLVLAFPFHFSDVISVSDAQWETLSDTFLALLYTGWIEAVADTLCWWHLWIGTDWRSDCLGWCLCNSPGSGFPQVIWYRWFFYWFLFGFCCCRWFDSFPKPQSRTDVMSFKDSTRFRWNSLVTSNT